MNEYISAWLENFERQVMIRRALIVSGNIIDLAFNRFNALTPINRVIEGSLKTQGFNQVIFYSRLNGISGISSDEWNQLTQIGMKVEQGEEYSFDDDTQTTTQSNSNSGRIPIEPQNFFAVAERVMTQTQNKVAFIIDPHREQIAVQECRKLGIPIVAVTDTNCDPDVVDYIIPGNDDAIRAIKLFVTHMADACLEGQAMNKDGGKGKDAEATFEKAAAAEAAEAVTTEAAE